MNTIPPAWRLYHTIDRASYLKRLFMEYIKNYTESRPLGATTRPAGVSVEMHQQYEHAARILAMAYINPSTYHLQRLIFTIDGPISPIPWQFPAV